MTVRTLRDAGNTPASWCREYLRSLRDYLLGFLQRTQPLQDSAVQVAKADEQFEADWAAGAVPGWADAGRGGPPSSAAAGALDVDAFDSVEELVQLGEGAQMPLATQPGPRSRNGLPHSLHGAVCKCWLDHVHLQVSSVRGFRLNGCCTPLASPMLLQAPSG